MLIGDLIRRRAQLSPEQEFWRDDELSINYGQVNRDANRIARALLAEPLRPGDHLAIVAGNCYEYTAASFGAAKAGMVLAHLNARSTAAELERLGDHSDALLVFVGAGQAEAAAVARAKLGRVRRWVSLAGADGPGWATPIAEWIAPHGEAEPELSAYALRPGAPAVFPEAPFQLLYTSGTTGLPKGVLISHRAKLRHGMTHVINLGLRAGDCVWSALPLCHQFAQWLVMVCLPLAGAAVASAPAFDAGACWKALRDGGITHLPAVPTMLYRLLDDPGAAGAPPGQLRCIVYGGAPMAADKIRELRLAFPGAALFQGFGQTEVGYCLGLSDQDHQRRPDSLGKADLFSELRLVDDDGVEVADGEVGELVAATPYLMNGYYKGPAETEAFFSVGPEWGRTGDLAVRDRDGFFVLAGRKQDLIISGGVNIYPQEVEQTLATHPAVVEAAVFGVPNRDWGESVHAAIVLVEGKNAGEAELKAHCEQTLAGYKIPRQFSFHGELPHTHNGKVRKVALRAPFWENEA
ncbi:MAG: class I adenylate-forming enzyme family protein [bacterium]